MLGAYLRPGGRSAPPAVLLLAVTIVLGCEKTGYPDLGEPIDQTLVCAGPTSSWIRLATAPGDVDYLDGSSLFAAGETLHEIVLLGAVDPSDPPAQGCFDTFQVGPPGEIPTGALYLRQGSFERLAGDPAAPPELEVEEVIDFMFKPSPQLDILQRLGSVRVPLSTARTRQLSLRMEGDELVITEGGVEARYVNFNRLAAAILLDTGIDLDERSRVAGNFFNLSMLSTQSRLLGFGGAGMTQYLGGNDSTFACNTSGEFNVGAGGQLIQNNIVTTIDFRACEDFTGMVLDGPQITKVTASGNGGMENPVDFSFQLDPTDATQVYAGALDFTGVDVVQGFGNGGTATVVHPDGTSVPVPTTAVTVVDLAAYLAAP